MGIIFKGPAILIFVVSGFWGLFICEQIIFRSWGVIGTIISFVLFPVLLTLAPLYQAFIHGDWFPVMLVYGGGIIGYILYAVGESVDARMARARK